MAPKTTKALAIGLIVALVAAIAVSLLRHNPSKRDDVVIAANLPLTGFLAEYGNAVRDGANMAADEIVAKNPDSPHLAFDWQDNKSDSTTALTVAQKQLLETPDVYISGLGPTIVLPVADLVARKSIPNFQWTFDVNIRKGGQRNNFRSNVSYKLEPIMFLQYAKERKAKRVAIIHLLLPHAVEEFRTIVVPELNKQGVVDVLVEPFELGKSDFSETASKLRSFRPDLLIINGFQMDLVNMIKTFRPLGLIKDGNTIGTFDMMDAMSVLGPEELEGIRAVVPSYIVAPTSGAKTWTERYVKRYARQPIYSCAFGYDAVTIIADAARRVKHPATADEWRRAIAATDIAQGITGPLRFDEGGDLMVPLSVAVFRAGKLEPQSER